MLESCNVNLTRWCFAVLSYLPPGDCGKHMQRGQLLMSGQRFDLAVYYFTAAMRDPDRYIEALRWRSLAHFKNGDVLSSKRDLEVLVDSDASTTQDFIALLFVYEDIASPQEVIDLSTRAIAEGKYDSKVYMYLARAHHALSEYAQALSCVSRFLKDNPDHPDGITVRGRALFQLGDFEAAMTDFARTESWLDCAWCATYLGNCSDAIDFLSKAEATYGNAGGIGEVARAINSFARFGLGDNIGAVKSALDNLDDSDCRIAFAWIVSVANDTHICTAENLGIAKSFLVSIEDSPAVIPWPARLRTIAAVQARSGDFEGALRSLARIPANWNWRPNDVLEQRTAAEERRVYVGTSPP